MNVIEKVVYIIWARIRVLHGSKPLIISTDKYVSIKTKHVKY